jgi:hypothetical protein
MCGWQVLSIDQMVGSDKAIARLLLALEERGLIKVYAGVLKRYSLMLGPYISYRKGLVAWDIKTHHGQRYKE